MDKEKSLVILDPSLKRGFTSVPNAVLFAPDLSMAAKCLYTAILGFAWQEDECFPGQERLAEACGCTDRTVRKYLDELREYGLISWVQRGLNRPNIYYIHNLSKVERLWVKLSHRSSFTRCFQVVPRVRMPVLPACTTCLHHLPAPPPGRCRGLAL